MNTNPHHDSGLTFEWDIREFDRYVRNCDYDDGVQLALKHLPKNQPVLEAGSGLGQVVEYLQQQQYSITGVEINPDIVAALNREKPHLNIIHGDITTLEFPDNYFGGILSYGVVEHFRTGMQIPLREQCRVLQPGGIMVITVPSFNFLRRIRFRLSANLQSLLSSSASDSPIQNLRGQDGFIYHPVPRTGEFLEYWLKPSEFENEIQQAGFKILESLPTHHWTGLWSLFGSHVAQNEALHFIPTPIGKLLHTLLQPVPFSHNFMHAIVATKEKDSV